MSPFSESGSTPPENTREDREDKRTEAGAWQGWAEALREQGATSLEVEVNPTTGKIDIEHVRKENIGIPGFGYDIGHNAYGEQSHRIWMKLTGEAEGTNANAWNANDRLEGDVPGVTFGEDGLIAADHPIAVLLRGLEEAGVDVEGHFVGNHNGWRPGVESMFKRVDDDNGEFVGYQVNLPEGEEGKVIIILPGDGRRVDWDDKGNAVGASQKLSITPGETS